MRLNIAIPEEHVTPEILDAGLEVATRLNEKMLRSGAIPTFDRALNAGKVKWQPEPPGDEHFDHGGIVLKRGHGDCDDLGPWAAASMRATGQDPGARAQVYKSGPRRWHAIVTTSDGELRDPSREAGMGSRSGILPATLGLMFPSSRNSVVGYDGEILMRPAIGLHRIGRGWIARTDIPWATTDYALSALSRAPVAAQAIVGSIYGAVLAAEAGEILRPEHHEKMMAVCGVLCGDDRDKLCHLCGEEAVLGAEEWFRASAHQLCGVSVSKEHAKRLLGTKVFDVGDLVHKAAAIARHPSSSEDERKLATLVVKHATQKPVSGGLIEAIMTWQRKQFGPALPGSAAEHARLLIADQAAKRLMQDPHFRAAASMEVTGDTVGGFFDDIGRGIGKIGKAVGSVVRDVAPIVAKVGAFLPPPYGPAIAGAASLIGGIAGKLVPKHDSVSPAAAAMPYTGQAPGGPVGPVPQRPFTFGTQPVEHGIVPPVHVHMASAPRGAAASAPVHVTAEPGGPVTIRF